MTIITHQFMQDPDEYCWSSPFFYVHMASFFISLWHCQNMLLTIYHVKNQGNGDIYYVMSYVNPKLNGTSLDETILKEYT